METKKSEKKNLGILVVFLVLFSTLCSSVYAKTLLVRTDPSGTEPNLISFGVSEPNYYTHGDFLGSVPQSPFVIAFFSSEDELMVSFPLMTAVNDYPFDPSVNTFRIYLESEFRDLGTDADPWVERSFGYCNNNGICEPCQGPDCVLIENYLCCEDCPSGSGDYFCDLQEDGVCDPDCEGVDGDCEDCEECVFQGQTCADLGGVLCSPGQECSGFFADDITDEDGFLVDNCCLDGSCRVPPEEVPSFEEETRIEEPEELEELSEGAAELLEEEGLEEDHTVLYIVIGLAFALLVTTILVLVHKKTGIHPGLGDSIDSLVRKGYNYSQIKSFLEKKGYSVDKIDSAIREDYQRRQAEREQGKNVQRSDEDV